MAISKRHLEKVIGVFAKEVINWEEIFNPSDLCESIYCLYIINAVVGDSSEKELAEIRHEPQTDERLALRLNILKSKVIEWCINYLKVLKRHTDNDDMIMYTLLIVFLINAYLIASLRANEKIPTKFLQYQHVEDTSKDNKQNFNSNYLLINK